MQPNNDGAITLTLADNLILARLTRIKYSKADKLAAIDDYQTMRGGVSAFHRFGDQRARAYS